jgi:hypothetical protein
VAVSVMEEAELTMENLKARLQGALKLRPPKFEYEGADRTPTREKIDLLESYLLESAFVRAELEEALHYLASLVAHFKRKVDEITGFEALLPSKPRDRLTNADVNAAKRRVDPVSFECGAEAKQVMDSTLRQIERLAFEEQWVISRAYSMISGSA